MWIKQREYDGLLEDVRTAYANGYRDGLKEWEESDAQRVATLNRAVVKELRDAADQMRALSDASERIEEQNQQLTGIVRVALDLANEMEAALAEVWLATGGPKPAVMTRVEKLREVLSDV